MNMKFLYDVNIGMFNILLKFHIFLMYGLTENQSQTLEIETLTLNYDHVFLCFDMLFVYLDSIRFCSKLSFCAYIICLIFCFQIKKT